MHVDLRVSGATALLSRGPTRTVRPLILQAGALLLSRREADDVRISRACHQLLGGSKTPNNRLTPLKTQKEKRKVCKVKGKEKIQMGGMSKKPPPSDDHSPCTLGRLLVLSSCEVLLHEEVSKEKEEADHVSHEEC